MFSAGGCGACAQLTLDHPSKYYKNRSAYCMLLRRQRRCRGGVGLLFARLHAAVAGKSGRASCTLCISAHKQTHAHIASSRKNTKMYEIYTRTAPPPSLSLLANLISVIYFRGIFFIRSGDRPLTGKVI